MSTTTSSLSSLPARERAAFAVSSRLLAALATESLLTTLCVPAPRSAHPLLAAVALVLAPSVPHGRAPSAPAHVFAVIPLCHVPVLRRGGCIALLDPLDMLPFVYEFREPRVAAHVSQQTPDDLLAATLSALPNYVSNGALLTPSPGPLHLWHKFAVARDVRPDTQHSIAAELRSSVLWQQHAYEHPPPAPTFDSPSIAWEHAIIEGHPTHPMHKARHALAPIAPIEPGTYDWTHPRVRFVSVPSTHMHVHGPWDSLIAPLRAAAEQRAALPFAVPLHHVLVPVHELQLPNITHNFADARIYPPEFALDALAQQSIRTVLIPTTERTHCLKLALGVRLTSALRTISPPAARLGPHFCRTVLPRLTYDRALLVVQRELASAAYAHADPDVARHLAGIVREPLDDHALCGERVVVCTALTEMGHASGVPLVQTVFRLDTKAKRLAWLDTFVATYFRAFLPPALVNGVAFEAHPQNTLARFDRETRKLKGFAVRDFGGLRVHTPTLCASTGLVDSCGGEDEDEDEGKAAASIGIAQEGHAVCAESLAAVHVRLYHTLVHNMLQQLVRVLGLHYGGEGWAVVRRHLAAFGVGVGLGVGLGAGEEEGGGAEVWGMEMVPGKCFLRMRMEGMYRTHLHRPFPNLVLYEGEEEEEG